MFSDGSLYHFEEHLESVIHMELLMAVEKRQALYRRRQLDLFETLHKDDILQNPGRGLAVHLRQLKAVTVQVDRMSIIRLIVENKSIAPPLLKRPRLRFLVKAGAVDCPAIKASLASIDFPKRERDRLVGILDGAVLAEGCIISRLLLRFH